MESPSSPRVASHAIPGTTPGGSSRMVNVHQARTQLSRLIDAAHAGETIVLAKAGKPWARFVPLEPPAPQRIPGRLRQHGPLGDPNALLEPLDPVELAAWDCSPLVSEARRPGAGDGVMVSSPPIGGDQQNATSGCHGPGATHTAD
jgi:antitoxin (DNA-binding transcriptional repressor) of toxin-antitoxin stability system